MFNFFKKKETEEFTLLKELLSQDHLREDLLGFRVVFPPSNEQVLSDTQRVIRYTDSSEYQIWAKEAWSQVLGCIDGLVNAKSPFELDFHRGRLVQTLKLLSISYKARSMKPALEQKVKAKLSVPSKNGEQRR